MSEKDEIAKVIDSLELPEVVKKDLARDYLGSNPKMQEIKTKGMVKMSGNEKEVAIILWEDDTVTVISTDKRKEPHISSANSPEIYYIAQKHYIDLGLQMTYAEENGKEIGVRK